MDNSNVLIPHAASDNALYLEEGKYWVWENIVLKGPWSWRDSAVCKKLWRGPWRERECPINQSVIWTDGQSTPLMSDDLQSPTPVASKFERSKWVVVGKHALGFPHPQDFSGNLLKGRLHKTRWKLLVWGNPTSYKEPTIPPPQPLFPHCHENLWTISPWSEHSIHSKILYVSGLTTPDTVIKLIIGDEPQL